MRHIEEAAIPTMAALVRGEPWLLDTISQRSLAAFLCLISIRISFSSHDMRAIPIADSDSLKKYFEPPMHWRIWIAQYQGSQVTTFVIGQLCAHLFSSTVWRDFGGYEGIALSLIWPPRQFDIDTRALPIVEEATVPWLHEAIAREL